MKRYVLAFAAASALVLGAPISTLAFVPQTTVATKALSWIQQTQLGADGAVGSDQTRTEEVIWGLVANHQPIATYVKQGSTNSPLDFLTANVAKEESTAGNVAQLMLAVRAAGQDASSFGPANSKHNLITDLQADYNTSTGQYGADIFGDVLSILALRSANVAPPPGAMAFLKSQQKPDGSWSSDNADAYGTDSNTTALALVALASASSLDGCTATNALSFLKTVQQSSGGFAFQAGSPSDPDSDGYVIEGLLAAGQDPTGAVWTEPGNKNALTDLASFQGADGSLSYPGIGPANLLATTQPLVALASEHLPLSPLGTSFAAPSIPACQTAAASPTPSPTVRPTATAAPTAVPVLAQTGSSVVPSTLAVLLGLIGVLTGWRLRRRVR